MRVKWENGGHSETRSLKLGGNTIVYPLRQFTASIPLGHFFKRYRRYFAGLPFAAERAITRFADGLHRRARRFQIFARIEFVRIFTKETPDRRRARQPQIRVDIHFTHAMPNALLNLFHGYAIGLLNFDAPCDVPIAIASASHCVFCTKSAAYSGSVSNCSRRIAPSAPWPSSLSPGIVSSEPRQPSSASTVTPIACAKPATCCVTSTLYTYEATVFPSSRSEPSIITLLKPLRIAVKHTAGDWP